MSSIYGMLLLNEKKLDKSVFEPMRSAMDHWNADRSDIYIEEPVALGQLMLLTTSESLNEQLPFHHAQHQLVITADARIDNREELFDKLRIDRHRRNISDSELILETYIAYKDECAQHMYGDFAFAIWDAADQSLFCARDHMGIRPFFYYHYNSLFLFASEKKGILAVPGCEKTIDEQFFVNQLYALPLQEIDTTLYKHIRRLPPAHTLRVNARDGKLSLKQYWELDADTQLTAPNDSYYYEGLRHHFEEAVKCRTRSAFTIGVELSGGLDSSAITGAVARQAKLTNAPFETFSNTLPPGVTDPRSVWKDERKYFEDVLRFNEVKNPNFVMENPFAENQEEIDFFLNVNDGMESWNSILMVGLKKKVAERNIRTLLSGVGGDQLVSSSHHFHRLALLDEKKYLEYFRRGGLLSKMPAVLPYRLQEWLLDTFHWLRKDAQTEWETNRICNIPKQYQLGRRRLFREYAPFRNRYKNYRHFENWQVSNPMLILRVESENRYGYYFKHNSCYPLLDVRLMQFYLSSPLHIRMEGRLNRPYFRKAVMDLLPHAIRMREDKKGGVNPYFYLRDRPFLDETKLTAERMPDNGLVNKNEVIERVKKINSFRAEWKRKHPNAPPPHHNVTAISVEALRWIERNQDFVRKFVGNR